jgi:hypothetical protein
MAREMCHSFVGSVSWVKVTLASECLPLNRIKRIDTGPPHAFSLRRLHSPMRESAALARLRIALHVGLQRRARGATPQWTTTPDRTVAAAVALFHSPKWRGRHARPGLLLLMWTLPTSNDRAYIRRKVKLEGEESTVASSSDSEGGDGLPLTRTLGIDGFSNLPGDYEFRHVRLGL